MALADRMDNGVTSQKFFYALLSDGEHDCGVIWEAAMLAGKNHLHTVIAIIDRNNIQIDGVTEDIMPLEPLRAKWEAFNWHVQEVGGHDLKALDKAIEEAKSVNGKPSVIIAHTIPGKGIPEIERDYRWHGDPPGKGPTDKIPADKQGEVFLHELRTLRGKIIGEHE
jgi:transketolase